ncbi:MAG TPA: ATP-binding protein [Kofleriaceae bacterium]|nr:ATP-binding protein [Kofleriaceae bacterium]
MHPRLRHQLHAAFPGGVPDLAGLDALVDAVSDAYTAADANRKKLESSIQLASDELVERNRALDRKNRDMCLILDNVAQGFATVALDGSIGNECSRAFTRWFGGPEPGARIWTHLAGHDPDLEAWIMLAFDSLALGAMPSDVVIAQLPPRIDRGGRQLRVEYRPIGEPLTGLLVVASDITDELARERAEAEQRELIAVVENAYRDRAGFLAFIRETNELVRQLDLPSAPRGELRRQVHTVKGNAAMFGALSVSEVCHELESELTCDGAPPDRAAWNALIETWRAFHDKVDHLLGLSERRAVLVDWDEYQAVLAALDDPGRSWAAQIRRWGQDRTRSHLERFAEQAQQLARRLGKPDLAIEIRDNGVAIETDRFAPLWSALAHAVRNAVDHGIEPGEQRLARGKPPGGRLTLTTELRGPDLAIEIEDDGGGIDWRAVAARATELGLPATTARDLQDAVFASGVSTARELTRTSGRGVGMAAVRAACAELGGKVELVSEPARGTLVRCVVPLPRTRPRTLGASFARG